MQTDKDIIQDLPADLNEAVNAQLRPEETVAAALRGAYGEAFVLTDRRAMVVREELPTSSQTEGVQVYSYLLGKIKDVLVNASGVSGSLVVVTEPPPPETEEASVYFPSYEQPRFEAAAEKLRKMIAPGLDAGVGAVGETATALSAVSSGSTEVSCKSCGGPVGERSVYCGTCGQHVASRCANCGTVLVNDAQYCTGCGCSREEAVLECPSCGKQAHLLNCTFCPDCGHILRPQCASCGSVVLNSWSYCSACGREIGAAGLRPLSRLQRYGGQSSEDRRPVRTEEKPASVEQGEDKSPITAAQYNDKGKELFDQDEVDEAIKAFTQATLLEPTNPTYHCNLAVALDDKELNDEAIAEYEKALELNPNELTALLYLGYLYSEKQDLERSIQMWERVCEVAPGSAEAKEAEDCIRHQRNI